MVKTNVHVVVVPPQIQVPASARNPGDVINAYKAHTDFSFSKGRVRFAQKFKNVVETLLIDGVHIATDCGLLRVAKPLIRSPEY